MIGPIVTNYDVEEAMKATITARFNTYLREMVRMREQDPEDEYPDLASVRTESEHGDEEQDGLPSVVIVSPGTKSTERHGGGDYSAKWAVGLAIMFSGNDKGSARRGAADYAGAMLAMLLQHGSLGGFASALHYEGILLTAQPVDAASHLATAYLNFVVTVDNTVDASGLPNLADEVQSHPDDHDDPGAWPTAEEVVVETEIKEV